MTYLVTGANGLVGNAIVKYLLNKKAKVRALIHKNVNNITKLKNVSLRYGNLLNSNSLTTASENVDIIIHCAAAINPKNNKEYYTINHQGTINLINAGAKNQIKQFIYISSWAADNNQSDYSSSKLMAENQVKKFKKYLIFRPADIYSKTKSHILNYIRSVRNYPVIPIVGDGLYKVSPVFIDDLIEAIYFTSRNYLNKTFTIAGPKIYTFNDFTKLILSKLNKNTPIVHLNKRFFYFAIDLFNTIHISLPIDREKINRLVAAKKIINVFNFEKISVKPLNFEDALDKFLLKNSLNS